MNGRRFLPSSQFSLLAVSLVLSGGLVAGANVLTRQAPSGQIASVAGQGPAQPVDQHWEAALYAIQAEEGSSSLPTPPSQEEVQGLLQGAQSSNMTDSVARTLFVNITNDAAQGLGGDQPTQNQLLAQAMSQISLQATTTAYTQSQLNVVADSPAALHAYGNALAQALLDNPGDEVDETLTIIDNATSQNDATQLEKLKGVVKEYNLFIQQIAAIPVPQQLSPLHLKLLNDFVQIAALYPDLEALLSDPVRGLSALEQDQTIGTQVGSIFTNIGVELTKDGILFNSDEPGSFWNSLASPSTS